MKQMQLAVLGGDERQIYMARALAQNGYTVLVWGLGTEEERLSPALVQKNWTDAVAPADAVILPLPATSDSVRIHCPLHHGEDTLRLSVLLDAMRGKYLLGGRLDASLFNMAKQRGVVCVDYFQSELLQLRNALPTAEGAISIAMRELPVTLDGTTVAVIGYGRIGALLAQKLSALGAKVYVYVRRREVMAQAELQHHTPILIEGEGEQSSLAHLPKGCRILFNTVPVRLLDDGVLSHVPKSCVLVDLASVPGGYDQRRAQSLGLRTVWGASLPGKCTPESAGEILARTVQDYLSTDLKKL